MTKLSRRRIKFLLFLVLHVLRLKSPFDLSLASLHSIGNLFLMLTDKLKKGSPEILTWSVQSRQNFDSIIRSLSDSPVLKLPDVTNKFVLRTDASGTGVGAVLLQYHDNDPHHPVAYASRKLLDRETRYSTIENELLAVVWAIQRFKYYLLGATFILEVYHKPLVYLNKFKGDNARLMQWALGLQAFHFQIVHINRRDNAGADFLSRSIV